MIPQVVREWATPDGMRSCISGMALPGMLVQAPIGGIVCARVWGDRVKEKELRFALVCYGGVSLAVYMHGVTKEILKLVRASRSLHAIRDRGRRAAASYLDGRDPA